MLAVLRNFSTESCGHARVGRGGGIAMGQRGTAIYPRLFALLGLWEKHPAQFWVTGSSSSATGDACVLAAMLGSGADSCFLLPSVYLYVFG